MNYFFVIILLSICQVSGSDIHSPILTINSGWRNETIITIDAQTHIDYGLAYPVTYEFIIPAGSDNLQSYRRFQATQDWSQMVEKTAEDFFNGIEAVRFDYDGNMAYISIGFSEFSDSIFIKLTDNDGNTIDATYSSMSQYYDNRDAAVTATADDWAGWVNDKFVQTCQIFRSFNLWLSCAIVTDVGDPNTWVDIQTQLDSGYVEAISHSRTHPYVPYDDLEGEVLGSMQDLIDNLDFPAHNRYGIHEYVYAWVAPYGEYDDAIDSMVSVAKYLVTRMYYGNDYGFSNWDQELYKYDPVGVSREAGPLWLGTTDTADLNNTFDEVLLVMFRAAFLGEFYSGENTVRQNDVNTRSIGRVLVQGTLTDFLALNFGLMAKSNVNSFGQPEAMLTQGDANLGVTGFYGVTEYLTLGADLNLFVPASFGSAGLDVSSVSLRPRLLATLDTAALTDGAVPLDAHLNIGYLVDRSAEGLPDGFDAGDV